MSRQSNIAGPGAGLALPQALYPFNPGNTPVTPPTNQISLSGGESLLLPAGSWYIGGGKYSLYQCLDPLTGVWRTLASNLLTPNVYQSDGANFRIFNPTGCVVAAIVTTAGAGYSQATATAVLSSSSNGTLVPIVGGNVNNVAVTAGGTGYTIPPQIYIGLPQSSPGVAATAHCSLSSGGVTSITLDNQGAGYTAAPTIYIVANPLDPNYTSITTATATAVLSAGTATSGRITAVLVTNSGQTVSAAPTITIAGSGGTSGAATAVWCNTVTAVVSSAGGTGAATAFLITSVGGVPTAVNTFNNPLIELTGIIPRPFQGTGVASAGVLVSSFTTLDPGLFFGTPTSIVIASSGVVSAAAAAVTFTTGTAVDQFFIQAV